MYESHRISYPLEKLWIAAAWLHGVGIDENITTASFKALFSALNRSLSEAEAKAA